MHFGIVHTFLHAFGVYQHDVFRHCKVNRQALKPLPVGGWFGCRGPSNRLIMETRCLQNFGRVPLGTSIFQQQITGGSAHDPRTGLEVSPL
jgi:hypothetical protein